MKPDPFGWVANEIGRLEVNRTTPDVDEMWHGQGAGQMRSLLSGRRLLATLVIAGLCMGVLLVRLSYLQIFQSTSYRELVDSNQYRTIRIPAPRGAILDRFGRALVENAPNYTLTIIPASIPTEAGQRDSYLRQVSTMSGLAQSEIQKLIANKKYSRSEAVPIISHIPYQRALQLSVQVTVLPGVAISAYPSREYIGGEAISSIMGYIGAVTDEDLKAHPNLTLVDEIGKTGLEWRYNDYLMGKPGTITYERTGANQFLSPIRQKDPVPGNTLRLTIDGQLQQKLYDRLKSEISAVHSTGGAAVAVDPRTGEILALVSAPSYDSNWFVNPDLRPKAVEALTSPKRLLLNRAIAGQYPSGSIIKPIISVAALTEHIITPQTTVLSTGGIKVGPNFFPDWKAGGHGVTNLTKALADSVNTFFYEIGGGYQEQAGLGVDRIVKYLSLFGWGAKTGIDLPNEADGFLPIKTWRENSRPTPWRLGDTYHLAIGQGDLEVTPLQVAMSQAAIANGGTLFEPRLVAEIDGPNGAIQQQQSSKVLRDHLATASVIAAVQKGLREGVISGSSKAMQSLPVAMAGKTGTAQFGRDGKTHAWYTAYGPYGSPTISITVIVEGGGEGHAAALPVAKDVLQWYFTRQNSAEPTH